jgi:D-alanyl-lipoteichoic acid acyltransferase DltB (MBOAT superfamily)
MSFNSYTFLLLFFVALAFRFNTWISWRLKKLLILLLSYIFYAAWNPPFVVLLWISTVVDWFAAGQIAKASSDSRRRLYMALSLIANLGLLGFFKYGEFVTQNLSALLGRDVTLHSLIGSGIILPIGISFYTFETLSYTIDVYRGTEKPWTSFLDYCLFLTFFPHLVAGPILRPRAFLPQCETPRTPTAAQFSWSVWLVLLGLFQKVVVADGLLAPTVELVYGVTAAPTFASAWIGTLAFAGQIFFDFAGYSTCAIGVAGCLGFILPDNFRFPYAAVGFSDFWRRWHISLSTWLRDYLYVSLGGNRKGERRTNINLMITMLLGGLWHGASWNFVLWGGLHGALLVIERWLRRLGVMPEDVSAMPPLHRAVGAALTFVIICFTWVFFRSESLDHSLLIAGAMLGFVSSHATRLVGSLDMMTSVPPVLLLLLAHWMLKDSNLERTFAEERVPAWAFATVSALMILGIAFSSGEDRAFIYFQF